MSTSAAAEEVGLYRSQFERFQAGLAADEPAWLRVARRQALSRFEERGFPTSRDEQWKHTSVAPIARARFRPAPGTAARVAADELSGLGFGRALPGPRLAFVDGRLAAGLSRSTAPEGVRILSLREALASQDPLVESHLGRHLGPTAHAFSDLNAAFLEDGALVVIPPGMVLAEPIHLLFFSSGGVGDPTLSHVRTLVVAGRGSQATIVESFGGREGQAYFTNAVSEVVLEEGAGLDHYKVQEESEAAFHVGVLGVTQGRQSRFTSHSLALGGGLVRNDINQRFAGEGGECALNGLFLARGRQHTDTHTLIDHARPHCSSRELYKGILDDRSRGVFHGTILVRKDAQKTDAYQTNKNLLLSREALVHSTPALEIFADDVKCKHGSTTGQLDPLALFYLRSRGMGEAAARSLLTYAFASDVVSRVGLEPLRSGLEQHLQSRLPDPLQADRKEALR